MAGMKRKLRLVLLLTVLSAQTIKAETPSPAQPVAGTKSFLDERVAPELMPHPTDPSMPHTNFSHIVAFKSFAERLKDLQAAAHKPITFPDGFEEFIQTEDSQSNWDKGLVLFSTERNGVPTGDILRDYLSTSLDQLTLTWKYDAARDAIITDFRWRREDPRTARELVDFLSHTRPPAHEYLVRKSHRKGFVDPWLAAFDALLSKPENLPQVWKLRFLDDIRKYFSQTIIDNLLAQPIYDSEGRKHFVFVNDQPEVISPGEGSICYYIFDESGKFERGAVLNSGHRCEETCAWINKPGNATLTVRTFFNYSTAVDTTFTLGKKGLVAKQPQDPLGPEQGCGKVLYATSP